MIEARTDVVRSANLSWVKIAGPHSFKVAATFRLTSVTTFLEFTSVSFFNLGKVYIKRVEVFEIRSRYAFAAFATCASE